MKPGRHGIDQDVAPRKLPAERLREDVQGRLFHRVGDLARVSRVADDARDVDDASAPLPKHVLTEHPFREVPDPPREGPLFVELLDLHRVDVGIDGEARVVDEHIDPPGLLLDCVHQGLHLVDLGQVGLQQKAVAHLRQEGLCARGAFPVVEPHTESFLGQGPGAGRPDPRAASRHDGHRFVIHAFIPYFIMPPTEFGDRCG